MSQVLKRIGFDCGHEVRINPFWRLIEGHRYDRQPWGDSSWLAAPFLADLPPTTKVVHVVREPIACMDSLIRTGHFSLEGPWFKFLRTHSPLGPTWPCPDVLEAAQVFWVYWNRHIEESGRVGIRVQVERVEHAIEEIVNLIDPRSSMNRDELLQVVQTVPTDVNTRTATKRSPKVPSLREVPLHQEVMDLAQHYGYVLN